MFSESVQLNQARFLFVGTNFLFMNGNILLELVTEKFKWVFENESSCVLLWSLLLRVHELHS